MIEAQALRVAGWQRIVSDLSALAGDDRQWLLRLLGVVGQVSGARQAVFFAFAQGGEHDPLPRAIPMQVWPLPQGSVDSSGRLLAPEAIFDPARVDAQSIERAKEVREAAQQCSGTKQVRVYSLDETQMYDNQSGQGYVIAVPVAAGLPHESPALPVRGVITLLVESRSKQAVQSVVALVEVLAGYVFTHEAQQSLKRSRQASASLDLAARLIAAMNSASGFRGCAMQMVNDLCRQLAVDRVALGWVDDSPARFTSSSRITPVPSGKRVVKLMALSDTEHFDRRMAMCRSIEAAMEECMDQEQAVLFPAPQADGPGADVVLSQTITHAHRDLAKGDTGVKIASVPLRLTDAGGERIAGVLLVEARGDTRLEPAAIELLQATLDLASPVLAVRASDDRTLAQRAGDWLLKTAAWAVGPRHTAWKAAGIALMLATLVLAFGRATYRVGAPMTLEPVVKRTISAPVAGTLIELGDGVKPGAKVRVGDVLAKLDTRELRLSMLEAAAQAQQSTAQEAEALKRGEHAEAAQAKARGEQAGARRDLLALQIERSTITAPIAGTVILGDLRDRIGATVRTGDELFQIADTGAMMVVARVEDADIALVRVGQTGELSPKADPSLTVPFVVDQIVPLSRAAEGTNIFEVRGTLSGGQREWFLPGLEGRAKINTQRRSLAWIASRRIIDQLRVWLWW